MWYQQHSHIWDNMRRSKQTKTKLMFGWRGESAVRQRAVQANQPALSNHVTAPGYKYQPAPSTPSSEHSQLQNRGAKFRTRIKMDVWHNDALGERVVGQPSSPLGPSEYPVLWRILRYGAVQWKLTQQKLFFLTATYWFCFKWCFTEIQSLVGLGGGRIPDEGLKISKQDRVIWVQDILIQHPY